MNCWLDELGGEKFGQHGADCHVGRGNGRNSNWPYSIVDPVLQHVDLEPMLEHNGLGVMRTGQQACFLQQQRRAQSNDKYGFRRESGSPPHNRLPIKQGGVDRLLK